MSVRTIRYKWENSVTAVCMDEAGSGPSVVLLPALSSISTRAEMRPLFERLAPEFRVSTVDWPGFGDLRRARTDWSPEILSAFLNWFLNEIVAPPHVFVAAGHAASYALYQAAYRHGTIERLVLIAPTWRGPLPTMMGGQRPWFTRIRAAVDHWGLRQATERLTTMHTPEGTPVPPNALAELQRGVARLGFVVGQIKQIEEARRQRLEEEPERGPHAMVRLLARVVGIGIETADMLVNEVLSRPLRDRRAVARYAGLTGAPDESGAKRREQGLAKAGNARVRRGMIQLAWRFLRFQKNSALTQWYQARTADRRGATRKTMIVALARKLLIALWRFGTIGEPMDGVTLRPAS